MMLIFILCIILVSSSNVIPNRRARVQSILVAPGGRRENDDQLSDIPLEVTNSTLSPRDSDLLLTSPHGQANPDDVIVDMDFIPITCTDHVRFCYKETPKGVFVLVGASLLFILGCLLILFLWK